MRKLFGGLLLLSVNAATTAQPKTDSTFGVFADRHSLLFSNAYKQRDTASYTNLLKEFLRRYEQLAPAERKKYDSYCANAYYNQSCIYSLLHNKKMALDCLGKAIRNGYANYSHIIQDSDFRHLHQDSDFKAIIEPLRDVGDYLHILKKDNARYTNTDSITIPAFTYQSADDRGLVQLRQDLRLDSIAGSGSEVSRIINVLHWVHNTIPHDGQRESGILEINGLAIASTARTKKIGVSCGELATVLNDCYLALGFKSRKIYCQPKDSLYMDNDAHVINVVYSPEKRKWLWMDPTNDAYVMDEQGNVLSIEEVRERLINDRPLILNPDANWNRRVSVTSKHYLYNYMAKNLYRFYCTLDSRFDVETRGHEKTIIYVNLVPKGYGKFREIPSHMQFYNKGLQTTFIHYTTHNPETFWRLPE